MSLEPGKTSPVGPAPPHGELRRQPREPGRLAHNIASLYGVQLATYLVPLALIPYLTRVLGAAGWGLVAFAQAFATYVLLVGEYGFGLSATRDVARHRDDPDALGRLLGDVVTAKLCLSLGAVLVAVGVQQVVPAFRADARLFWGATAWALAQAFSMLWYFQGLERMRLVAALEISAKVVGALAVFAVVRGPDDAWKVLAVQAIPFGLMAVIGWVIARGELPRVRMSMAGARTALATGWQLFFFRGAVSFYTSANAFILGLFAPPTAVGYYAAGEKLAKASLGLVGPVSQALYPRLSHLAQTARERAAHLLRKSLLGVGGIGVALGVGLIVFAPAITRVVLGPGFEPTILVLRILAFLPPLIAVSNVLGMQWMLPLGLEATLNRVILAGGVLNIVLALVLAPLLQHIGMAVAVVCTEFVITAGMYVVLRRRDLMPFSDRLRVQATQPDQ